MTKSCLKFHKPQNKSCLHSLMQWSSEVFLHLFLKVCLRHIVKVMNNNIVPDIHTNCHTREFAAPLQRNSLQGHPEYPDQNQFIESYLVNLSQRESNPKPQPAFTVQTVRPSTLSNYLQRFVGQCRYSVVVYIKLLSILQPTLNAMCMT